jgi:hypothetical protein
MTRLPAVRGGGVEAAPLQEGRLLLIGQKKPELFKGRVILDKSKGGFILADDIVAQTLARAFFAIISFVQGISASAEGVHDQLAVFHFGYKVIRFFIRRLAGFMMGHPVSPQLI